MPKVNAGKQVRVLCRVLFIDLTLLQDLALQNLTRRDCFNINRGDVRVHALEVFD